MSRMRMAGAAVMAAAVIGLAATVCWSSRGGPAPAPTPEAAGGAERIDGRVSLAPGSGPTPEGAMVVAYAYAVEGSQVPLAVLRRPATALPLDRRLDDSLAPSSGHRLSGVRQLVIGARLGTGGEALSQVGDWLAASQKVALGAQGVQLVLQPPPK